MSQIERIIVLSDGTGNSASAVWRTNVWRVYQALDLTNGRQVALYDDGVGTSSFKPLAIAGGAFGWGLKRNVLDLYGFICRNYRQGVDIHAFGFSRGAFTIRVLVGLIADQGLVPFETEEQLMRDAAGAYRAYRRRYNATGGLVPVLRWLRDRSIEAWQRARGQRTYGDLQERKLLRNVPAIRFVGVWDTVSAYGLPIEEMTRGVDLWLWPMSPPDRRLSDKVTRACHALALDDARLTFHPMLWTEADETTAMSAANTRDERISQVWFTGMHSNVGGGYPDDGLAHVSLTWMLNEACAAGLQLKQTPNQIAAAAAAADQDGRLYDSRHGLGGSYRYGPRKLLGLRRGEGCQIQATPGLIRDRYWRSRPDEVEIPRLKIHESVFQRIRTGARGYAPINVPEDYAVVMGNGDILGPGQHGYEPAAQARQRALSQESVWNSVWRRRIVYFASFLAAAYLFAFPWCHATATGTSRFAFLAEPIKLSGALLPAMASRWIEAFAASPGWFALGAGLLVFFLWLGGLLEQRIRDEMRMLWDGKGLSSQLPDDWVFGLRTHGAYVATVVAVKYYVLPTFFAFGFAAALVYGAWRALSFTLASLLGRLG